MQDSELAQGRLVQSVHLRAVTCFTFTYVCLIGSNALLRCSFKPSARRLRKVSNWKELAIRKVLKVPSFSVMK